MFRKKSLERLSTPDRLDQLVRVVRRKSWLLLLGVGLVLAAVLVWSVVGRIPVTAEGVAVLVHPRQVVPVQSPASGQLLTLDVRVGDVVERDQVLGTLHHPEIEKQLEQERARLEQYRARRTTMASFERTQAARERDHLTEQQKLIEQRVTSVEERAERSRERNTSYIEKQRESIETTRRLSEELGQALQKRYEALQAEEGAAADLVVAARRGWVENEVRLAELDVKSQEIHLLEIQSDEAYERQMDLIAELHVVIQGIALSLFQIDRRLGEDGLETTSGEQEIQREIGRLQSQLEAKGRIVSEHRGRVLEITVGVGAIVSAGQRIGTIEAVSESSELMALAYFPIRDGKRIRPDMKARVSPATVQREQFGSMLGSVRTASDYPVTTEAAANQVGNRELAELLTQGRSQIEVFIALDKDAATHSGFAWTSSAGPGLAVTAGTTASVRVTLERLPPIALVIPGLRDWFAQE